MRCILQQKGDSVFCGNKNEGLLAPPLPNLAEPYRAWPHLAVPDRAVPRNTLTIKDARILYHKMIYLAIVNELPEPKVRLDALHTGAEQGGGFGVVWQG